MKMHLKRRLQKYSDVVPIFIIFILIICSPFVIFFSSFKTIAFNLEYYNDKYIELGVYNNQMFAGVDLLDETSQLLRYIKSGKGEIQSDFYNQREKDHLVDVREKFRIGMSLRRFFFFFSVILLLFLFRLQPVKEDYIKSLGKYLAFGSTLTLVLLGILWLSLSNFEGTFISFHEASFEDGTWTFDENTDHLVNMFPLKFFEDISRDIAILAMFIAVIGLIMGLLMLYGPRLSAYYKGFINKKS